MNFVCVDIGASGTRFVTNSGAVHKVPNNMVMLTSMDALTMEPKSKGVMDGLELFVTHMNEGGGICGQWHVAYGNMASRYSGNNATPNMLRKKFEQEINILSTIMAAALGVVCDGADPKMGLYLALPPAEVKGFRKEIKEQFAGRWVVQMPKLGRCVELEFTHVEAYEESFLAMLDFLFNTNGSLRPEGQKYQHGNLLSLDIGASTTDLVVVSDLQYLEHTGRTIRVGGNTARQVLGTWVSQKYGFDARPEMLDKAVAEGRIQLGNAMVDCSMPVKEAKRQLAQEIVSQVTDYFRSINIPIQNLRAIVVSGGGSMKGMYSDGVVTGDPNVDRVTVTSPSVAEYISEFILDICPTVAIEYMERNPRLANVYGLFIRANMDMLARAERSAAEAKKNEAPTIGTEEATSEPVNTTAEAKPVEPEAKPVEQETKPVEPEASQDGLSETPAPVEEEPTEGTGESVFSAQAAALAKLRENRGQQ